MKVGILGGGQLGRMLLQAAANYTVETHVLENDENCPSAHLCHHFTKGDITDFDTVYQFGKGLDAITIEIEAVNVDALEKLQAEGVKVYPQPIALFQESVPDLPGNPIGSGPDLPSFQKQEIRLFPLCRSWQQSWQSLS